jgi:hypothetical protein
MVRQITASTVAEYAPMFTGGNQELVAPATLAWDGATPSKDVVVPTGMGGKLYIRIDNTGNDDRDTVITFQFAVDAEKTTYQDWYTTAAAAVTFTAVKSTARVYGPFEYYPRFYGGKIVVAGSGGNIANNKSTIVQVWEA